MGATAVMERPILFSGPMVKAILDGRKTMTRRAIKPQPPKYIDELHGNDLRGRAPYPLEDYETGHALGVGFQDDNERCYRCPYGMPGDRLWVRETWGLYDTDPADGPENATLYYRATDGNRHDLRYQRWRPSIHMPRWASRLTLEVTSVRVERLQEISDCDAISEGIRNLPLQQPEDPSAWWESEPGKNQARSPVDSFRMLWNSINGKKPDCSWAANPWVWVVSFKRIRHTPGATP